MTSHKMPDRPWRPGVTIKILCNLSMGSLEIHTLFQGLFLSYIFFPYKYHLYHQKTTFVNSFHQKVVLVASYVCLASRGRQKWYSWYPQDISFTWIKNAVKTLLLQVPTFSIPFGKSAVLVGYFVYIILHNYALLCKHFKQQYIANK